MDNELKTATDRLVDKLVDQSIKFIYVLIGVQMILIGITALVIKYLERL
jgi:hypothetical protein